MERKNIIEIDYKYRSAFSSIVTLVKCGCNLSDVIESASETEIYEKNTGNVYQLVDSVLSSEEQEISIEEDGSTWFRGFRGQKINEGMASWLTLMEKVAEKYHKLYSFVEYNSNELTKEELARIENSQKRDIEALLEAIYPNLKGYSIKQLPIGQNCDDIYGLTLKLSIASGGTGESNPVLGKLYFQKSISNTKSILNPLSFDYAYDIDKFFKDSVANITEEGLNPIGRVDASVINNVASALGDLFNDFNAEYLNDEFIFNEEDKKLIDTLYQKNPNVNIVITAVKLLTITHVKWNNIAYDIVYNGEPILRVKFGINNNLTLSCIKCGLEDIISGGKIYYKKGKVNVSKPIQIVDGVLQLSENEIDEIRNSDKIKEHIYFNQCEIATRGITCSNLCCKANAIDYANGVKHCANCPYPEVVFETNDGKLVLVEDMQFAYDLGNPALISDEVPVETCSFCGRPFTKIVDYCGFCSQICYESSSADYEKAEKLYKDYQSMLPLSVRLLNLSNKKYCFEDAELIAFKVGKQGYIIEKNTLFTNKRIKVTKVRRRV